MLVVNNGVPKSGTTLVQKALMLSNSFVDNIGQYQNPNWANISVKEDDLNSFLNNYDYTSNNVCLKMHVSAEIFAKNPSKDIKVVTTYRNLMDSVVSMAFHLLRKDTNKLSPREHWIDLTYNAPKRYGRMALRFGMHYLDAVKYGSLLIKYEELVGPQKATLLQQIFDYAGIVISQHELHRICDLTNPGIKSVDEFKENSHVRTGGISTAESELPEFTYTQLSILNDFLFSSNCDIDSYQEMCQKVIDGVPIS